MKKFCFFILACLLSAEVLCAQSIEQCYMDALDLMKTERVEDYVKARKQLEKILPHADADLAKRIAPKIPLTWYFEGAAHELAGNYEAALPSLKKARAEYHALGMTDEEIKTLLELGYIRENLSDYSGAEKLYIEANDLAVSSQNKVKQLDCLGKLSRLYFDWGHTRRYQIVNRLQDSLMTTEGMEKSAPKYFQRKGDEARRLDQLDLAEEYYKRAGGYSQLWDLYCAEKRYDEALVYAELSLRRFQSSFVQNDAYYYLPYRSFVELYMQQEDSSRATVYLDSLFQMVNYTVEPRLLRIPYSIRARFYSHFRNYAAALADYQRADSILAIQYGPRDEHRVVLLALMGGMEGRLKHYAASERLLQAYTSRIKALYGEDHIDYINALTYQANAEAFAGHLGAAAKDYVLSVLKLKQLMVRTLPYLSRTEKEALWESISRTFADMTPFALAAKDFQTVFTRAGYNALLLSKAFLLESEQSVKDVLNNKGTELDRRDFVTFTAIQDRIRELERNYTENADSIFALTQRMMAIDSKLKDRCRAYGDITSFMDISYEQVKEQLRSGEVLVDYTDFVPEGQGRTYAAYLVNPAQENPLLVRLGTESGIDSLDIARPDMLYDTIYSAEILKRLWTPLADSIPEGTTVYYVPSHLLFQIALESLPLKDGSLLGDHYKFVRLSTAREICNISDHIVFRFDDKTAVLYGGLQYDLAPSQMVHEARKYALSPLLAMRGKPVRGDSVFHEISETKKEIEDISRDLKQKTVRVTSYTGFEGTEESFLNLSGKAPDIVHMATHGFYYNPTEAQQLDYLRGYKDAMSLSGLVMAGGNAAWLGRELPDGVLDGILTANRIAQTDLSGADLVVLSACQTGQGEATSEGLYGLQRAFKKAGANTLVMSLWSVDDVVTREFMEAFYKNLTSGDDLWNKRDAFQKAKSFIRNEHPDPYYWAAFIMLD